ncbi:MAG: hypothetical protein HFF89_07090 [Oscillibacter sp.]|jgi:hypothetical protein|nr:hypothetical protein [Oscillibacter sp.]MCI8689188.1 hypothetical protein [Oscillibacter sp.]MCI9480981.1 hypothetical protein [Oscillibacter sp.]
MKTIVIMNNRSGVWKTVTCAVDPEVILLHSWVDIYTPDYERTIQCGLQKLTGCWTEARGGSSCGQT